MEKIYLVINAWSNDNAFDMQNVEAFEKYEDAKKSFERIKKEIKSFNTGYDEITDEKDYYCESINGEYIYYHELVYILEKELK